MQSHLFLLSASALLACADLGDGEATKKELAKLQGTWKVIKAEIDGKQMSEAEIGENLLLIIRGNKIHSKTGDREDPVAITFALDPGQKLKAIDITPENPKKGLIRGLYQLQGDTLTLCTGAPGAKRPAAMPAKTKAGSGLRLSVLKRKKS